MKLKSIRIINMHSVEDETFEMFDGFTYFNGPNGVGKSTILEAIQLVILGYIPGYAKTNESIMKHSSKDMMQVIGTFDNDAQVIRTWKRSGTSVSSTVDTLPPMLKADLHLVDDQLELPIYNFSEFKDLTANKLKEWFISFLPAVNDCIDWSSRLIDCLGERRPILSDELLNETLDRIATLSATYSGLDLVKALNESFKTDQSYYKKEIERLEGTIQSLIHYDEDLPSEESIEEELSKYMDMFEHRASYDANIRSYQSVQQQIDQLGVPADSTVQSVEDVEGYVEIRNEASNLDCSKKALLTEMEGMKFELTMLTGQLSQLSTIQSDSCPYTSKKCREISKILEENSEKIKEVEAKIAEARISIQNKQSSIDEIDKQLFVLTNKLQDIESKYSNYFRLRKVLQNMVTCEEPELVKEEIEVKLAELRESLSKIEANKRYNELISTITNDKYVSTNRLEVVKIWTKLTDANGLQTELMTRPFEELGADMNSYLSTMFGVPTEAHFNLSSKANSFSFGLIRNGEYIIFDYLSSGERCLFMLAMMICIMDKSNSDLRTILVDDLIDHLDDKNAENVYKALHNLTDVQFILAGVKELIGLHTYNLKR